MEYKNLTKFRQAVLEICHFHFKIIEICYTYFHRTKYLYYEPIVHFITALKSVPKI